jgi:predicted RNase H-like nuclease (RuvC/YqgF family)
MDFPISESITAVIAGVIGWLTGGKTQKESAEIQNAKAVLAMWQETADAQKLEIEAMRREIQALREKLDEMETHVRKIESENIELKRLLNK